MTPSWRRVRDALDYRIPFRRGALTARRQRAYMAAVAEVLDRDDGRRALRGGESLPSGWGAGLSERLVEFPWVAAKLAGRAAGLTLDAGSTLNHPYVLDALLPLIGPLHIVTLAPEPDSFPERGISYIYADLRDLPLRSDLYDTVVCVSTLEHVGMDVSGWGASVPIAPDPQAEALRAAREIRRVVRPGGRVLLTVPYGLRESLGWWRQFDASEVAELGAAFDPASVEVRIYQHGAEGWQLSTEAQASESPPQEFWASAVACLDLTIDGG